VPNLSTRTVKLTVGSGVNIVTYTNQIDVSAQKGLLEICKNAGDSYVSGHAFWFTILDAAGLTYGPFSVLAGQCTSAITVTQGPATITEAAQAPFYLYDVYSIPSQNLISQNDTNGTASVNVVATDTTVFFENYTELGFIKVCKALDSANSDALAGTTFVFNWSVALSTGGSFSGTAYVVANTFENGPACVFLNFGEGFPLGSIVTISEVSQANVVSTSTQTVTVSGTWNPDGSPGNNISSVTFTNQAEGTIEICKTAADSETLGNGSNAFSFVVNGSIDVTVNAGQCSAAIAVPAGTATVDELAKVNFHEVSVTATGPDGSTRIISGTGIAPDLNPITVSVPFGGVSNETLVDYTNAVNTGEFKICKTSSSSLLADESFVFNWNYTLNGTTFSSFPYGITLKPGQCGWLNGSLNGLSGPIPVVDNTGAAVTVNVSGDTDTNISYVLGHQYFINSITYSGSGSLTFADLTDGDSSFTIGQGINQLTYDNEPCASNGCPSPTGRIG
jgi:hypothetical protein